MVRRAANFFGYDIKRMPLNRFESMNETLRMLCCRGFVPDVVVDVGAHIGTWTKGAISIWPHAEYHLIEPQPECGLHLDRLKKTHANITVHSLAVTAPGINDVRLVGRSDKLFTGVFVAGAGGLSKASGAVSAPDTFECKATSLDELFLTVKKNFCNVLLKMDVECHEPEVLKGAVEILKNTEIVISEVEFLGVHGFSTSEQVRGFLSDRGFEVYDFASLIGRVRDQRLRMADVLFIKRTHPLFLDKRWI